MAHETDVVHFVRSSSFILHDDDDDDMTISSSVGSPSGSNVCCVHYAAAASSTKWIKCCHAILCKTKKCRMWWDRNSQTLFFSLAVERKYCQRIWLPWLVWLTAVLVIAAAAVTDHIHMWKCSSSRSFFCVMMNHRDMRQQLLQHTQYIEHVGWTKDQQNFKFCIIMYDEHIIYYLISFLRSRLHKVKQKTNIINIIWVPSFT